MDALLLQNADELDMARECLKDSIENIKIVAWSPLVIDTLKRNNLPYTTVSDYTTEVYQPTTLISQYRQYKQWCAVVDIHVSEEIPDIMSLGIRPFFSKINALRQIFFLYFSEINNLYTLVKKTEVNSVYYFHYPTPQLSLLSRIMDIIQNNNKWGVNFVRLEPESEYRSMFPDAGIVTDWFDRKRRWERIARFVVRKPQYKDLTSFLAGFSGCNLFKNKAPNILILNTHFDVEKVLEKLKQRIPCNFVFWEDVTVKNPRQTKVSSNEIINKIRNDHLAHQWTTYHGIDLFDLFIPEIQKTINSDTPFLISTVRKFLELNDKFKFSLVIAGNELTQISPIFDKCEDLEIPVALFLHGGGCVGPLEGYPIIQVCLRGRKERSQLYYFIYSEGIANYCENLKKYFPEFTSHNIPVGSSYFEGLLEKNSKMKTDLSNNNNVNICYVCGPVSKHNCNFNSGLYNDAALYDLRYKVIEILGNKPGISVLYKMGYNTENYGIELEKRINKGFWKNIKSVSSSRRLTELLEESDVFVLEIPSTTLFEVLTTSKPVILLIEPRALALTEQAEKLLRNRVVIVSSWKEMELCLEDIVKNRRKSEVFTYTNHDDKTFLTTYATRGDYKSAERTVDFLEAIIRRKTVA